LSDATCLCHLRRRKKKANGYIIPAKHFYGRVLEIAVESPQILESPAIVAVEKTIETNINTSIAFGENSIEIATTTTEVIVEKPAVPVSTEPKVSAFSLASIRAKKEIQEANKSFVREEKQLPTEPFTETEMLLQWNKYAQRLGDKGQKIMESLLLINDPKLEGTTIIHELPNEGSKIDFDNEKFELQGYLRGKLHNHNITINVVVNETVENKFAFTTQDKFNRLNQINPTLDVLKKTFDLDL